MPGYGKSIQTVAWPLAGTNVLEAAQARVADVFARFPHVSVDFSGGKDSTVVLHLAVDEARRLGRQVNVLLSDEEAIDPDTLAYLEHVRSWPAVRFYWCCAPVCHTLHSHRRTLWTCWDAGEAAVWIRAMPPGALSTHPQWRPGMTLDQLSDTLLDYGAEAHCHLVGIRCEESFNRRRALLQAGTFLTRRAHSFYAKPIYDWKTTDVWAVIKRQGWPYSAFYDKARQLAMPRFTTRVAPIGNVASTSRMHLWAQLYPAFWDQVLRRLPELDPMARYGRTKLYRKRLAKPLGLTWQEWTFHLLAGLPQAQQQYFRGQISNYLVRWGRTHSMPYPDAPVHEADGQLSPHSWQRFAFIIAKHDSFGGEGSRDFM